MSCNCEKYTSQILCYKGVESIVEKPVFNGYAGQLSVDDDILVYENGILTPAKVTGISDMELQIWEKSNSYSKFCFFCR